MQGDERRLPNTDVISLPRAEFSKIGLVQELIEAVMEWSGAREEWRPLPRWAIVAWIAFYVWFLLYAVRAHGEGLFIDNVNLVVHEGGHLLFRWFGTTLHVWGGTILQLLVPLLLAAYFLHQRSVAAFTFCMFFFFENFLGIATYMADARAMVLPLVSAEGSDFIEHDWHTIFSSLGLLRYDTTIAAIVRMIGWSGMVACLGWLAARAFRDDSQT